MYDTKYFTFSLVSVMAIIPSSASPQSRRKAGLS
jgi:hypothetical protein